MSTNEHNETIQAGAKACDRLSDDFFFGAALSGPQTEGMWQAHGKLENLWDLWSNQDIRAFHNRVGSYAGNDMGARYAEDFALFHELGLSSCRTSIQWSRLMDADGHLNPEGAEFYHRLFAAAREAGVEVFANLYHFDMPAYLFRRGGWENREVVEAYASYARAAFTEFGQEIEHWFTFNEPIVEPEQRYTHGVWFPFHRDFAQACRVQYGISLAHALAVDAFRTLQSAGIVRADAKIGLINCFTPPYTREDPTAADLEAVRMVDGLHNRWWLDLVTRGTLPADVIDTLSARGVELPERAGDKDILARGTVDWLGFNYYQPTRVQAPAHDTDELGNPIFADRYVWPDAVMNTSRGWEIYPKGIYDFAMTMTRDYPDLEWFVSENGIGIEEDHAPRDGEGHIEDASYRVSFVRDHLRWVARAIAEGARCRGYHYWGVIDCWSWNNAFKNRYGFVEVDLTRGYERRFKQSATWLRQVATTHVVA
ncbi:MAG: glycoside hydrolase family 1 protein [Coriobacteriales bacterium]|nr:glycoside hydrolase family 1 protein [Coriobacteriales bacterium]